MHDKTDIDYGPLAALIGTWTGSKGLDVAPEPDGTERSPYYETIVFEPGGDVENAESQVLALVHYRQIVRRKSNDKVFHDETGYWTWDLERGVVTHVFVIPRGVAVVAGGEYRGSKSSTEGIVLEVHAKHDHSDWKIIEAPFMQKNARTLEFQHEISVNGDAMVYAEKTTVDIYGNIFEHTDENELKRVQM
jgi:hypothetical protein